MVDNANPQKLFQPVQPFLRGVDGCEDALLLRLERQVWIDMRNGDSNGSRTAYLYDADVTPEMHSIDPIKFFQAVSEILKSKVNAIER